MCCGGLPWDAFSVDRDEGILSTKYYAFNEFRRLVLGIALNLGNVWSYFWGFV